MNNNRLKRRGVCDSNTGDCRGCDDGENGGNACCGVYQQANMYADCAKGCITGLDGDCQWPTQGGGGGGGGGGCYGRYEKESCENIGQDCNKVQECLVNGNGWNCFTDSQCKNPYNNKHPDKHHHKKPNNFYEKLMELIHYIENKL